MTAQTFDHPFFARMWTVMSAHEAGVMKKLRKENLAGLTGRVLEVGAGTQEVRKLIISGELLKN